MRALIACVLILSLIGCVASPNDETAQEPVPTTAAASDVKPMSAPAVDIAPPTTETSEKSLPVSGKSPDSTAADAPVIDTAPSATGTTEKEVPATAKTPDAVAASAPVVDIVKTITGPAQKSSATAVVDASCKTDSDCTVKNVGSCCGYYPRCVNKDSPTFPEQVKAQCAKKGRMGICGFPAISACHCDQGKCAAIGSDVPVN